MHFWQQVLPEAFAQKHSRSKSAEFGTANFQPKFLAEDRHQHVNADGNPLARRSCRVWFPKQSRSLCQSSLTAPVWAPTTPSRRTRWRSLSAPAKASCAAPATCASGALIEAVRDQTRIVDIKQVNHVLIQSIGEKTVTTHCPSQDGAGGKSAPPGSRRWCRCSSNADSNSSPARRAILFCPPIPASSSKTVTGAGSNVIWPGTPLTSMSRCSACPSTMPCARSPAHKTTAGGIRLRRQLYR